MAEQKNARRRGDELKEDLFNATLKLAREINPINLTFQQIAEAANTSRTVLYRRWPTTFELLQDIYTYKAKELFEGNFFDTLKDTGSLRGDLIQLLNVYQRVYSETGSEILNNYFYLIAQNKGKNKDLPVHVKAVEKHAKAVRKILKNAQSRGEKIKKIADVTLMLPFDLIRIENLVRPEEINEKRLEMMVDEVLLPVYKE